MFDVRLLGMGVVASSSLLLAAPALPEGCGGGGAGAGPASGGAGGTNAPEAVCGNGRIEWGEYCEGSDFAGRSASCTDHDYRKYTNGTVSCDPDDCTVDYGACTLAACGNGRWEGAEACDGADGPYTRCEEWDSQYAGGVLSCGADCEYDSVGCRRPVCGDGVVEGREVCDGSNLGDAHTCQDVNSTMIGGVLRCGAACDDYDLSGCQSATCGDGIIQGDEECEGTDLGQSAGKTCADVFFMNSIFGIPTNYGPGYLKCTNCRVDSSGCQPAPGCYQYFARYALVPYCI
jgi:hypothetical protein